jgi:hypothetical protein
MRAFVAAAALLAAGSAQAAEINAMMTTAMKAAFDELLPPFERANGHTVRVIYGPSGALLRHLNGGEPTDLFATDIPALDGLLKQGKAATSWAFSKSSASRRRSPPKPNSPWAGRTVGSACSFPAARPRSASNRPLSCSQIPTSK